MARGVRRSYHMVTFIASVCVCVSHPGSKGFPPFHLPTTTETVPIFHCSYDVNSSKAGEWSRPAELHLTKLSAVS